MLCNNSELLLCYNRGCGNTYDPKNNKEDSCIFHPGNPFFHDAYKGWSCCNKKCTDFTEFLNIRGCTKSFHSNVKPPEPEKPVVDKSKANEIIEHKAAMPRISTLKRPPFDSPFTQMKPEISNLLKNDMEKLVIKPKDDSQVIVGTSCKNGGCKASFEGPSSNNGTCIYHPGVPMFHEGLKFWTCCKKKKTDFTEFLEQVGCEKGVHVWSKKSEDTQADCRFDWHQTSSYIVVSVYAKKYDPNKSVIKLNPVRLKIGLFFPETNLCFEKDFELHGVVDVEKSQVGMYQTKVEIKLKKAEPGSWSKLEVETEILQKEKVKMEKPLEKTQDIGADEDDDDDSVDLSDVC